MDEQQESTTPGEERDLFNWRLFIFWPLVIVLLYIVSWGPVWMASDKGLIPLGDKFVDKFYWPVGWTYSYTPLHKPLGMYLHLWVPDYFSTNGELLRGR